MLLYRALAFAQEPLTLVLGSCGTMWSGLMCACDDSILYCCDNGALKRCDVAALTVTELVAESGFSAAAAMYCDGRRVLLVWG